MRKHAAFEVEVRSAPSYEALADLVRAGGIDAAWLPPIVYLRLVDSVRPIGSIRRGGMRTYEAALIVRGDSKIRTIDSLRGTRAGWVDRWSAAGFVLPRVKLALSGIDPRTLFRTETFHGTHRAAIQALLDGACEVVGTHARKGEDGTVVAGAWSAIEGADVRVLSTFGAIPPDVIGVRNDLPADETSRLAAALAKGCEDDVAGPILAEVFGGREFSEGLAPGYDSLRSAIDMAAARGLFD